MKTWRAIVATAFVGLLAGLGTSQAADFSSWGKRMSAQFTGYSRSETLTNFPALVVLGTNLSGFSYADFVSGTNADLRFTDATQTNELNYEIEKWNTNGSSFVWVQVPRLTNNASIYAFWGLSGQTAPSYTTNGATWTNGCVGVWHLNEAGTGTRYNSTTNAYGATPTAFTGAEAVTGQVAGASELNGTSKYLSVANQSVYDLGQVSGKQWTVSAWYYAKGSSTSYQGLVGKRGSGSANTDYLVFTENSKLLWGTGSSADSGAWLAITEPARSNWHHVVGTLISTGAQSGVKSLFVDGVPRVINTNYAVKASNQSAILALGTDSSTTSGFFQGILDEIRVENVARSSNWVWACYLNQASNSVFATNFPVQFGSPVIQNGAASNVTASSATLNGSLSSTGGAPIVAVSVYWGTNDGGTVAANWSNSAAFTPVPQAAGPLSTNVTGLLPNALYYYRYYATNSLGGAWADPPATFITGDITVLATTPNVSESGPVNGIFTLTRPDWSTNLALTVSYSLAGSAINGTDYSNLTGQATFPVGATNTTVTVTPIADGIAETSETVDLTLTGGGGVPGTPSNATVNIADGTWYVTTNGLDTNSGTNWAQAFATISNAVARAAQGDLVLVTNGTYNVTTNVLLDKVVRVIGVGGCSNTVVQRTGVNMTRIFKLTHPGAVLSGFTIRNGSYWGNVPDPDMCYGAGIYIGAGTVTNCLITQNVGNSVHAGDYTRGGGVFMSGGLLVDSTVFSNNWTVPFVSGGGVYMTGGTLRRCVISANRGGTSQTWQKGMDGGGGIRLIGGTVENCLIVRNQTGTYNGGGVLMSGGVLLNCTVADNYVLAGSGAGVRRDGGAITNTIVYYNTGTAGAAENLIGGGAVYSCAPELTTGTGNKTADPSFVNRSEGNWRLKSDSPCIDAGTNLAALVNDRDGNARPQDGLGTGQAVHDMGCYEYVLPAGVFGCNFAATTDTVGYTTAAVGFAGYAVGTAAQTNTVFYRWNFGSGTTPQEGWGLARVTNTFGPGRYDITLSVSNSLGDVTNAVRNAYVRVAVDSVYAATNGGSVYPYASWGTAATNLIDAYAAVGDALDHGAAQAGILVGDGTFDVYSQLALTRSIDLRSVNGRSQTAIRQRATEARVVYLSHTNARVTGFTLRGSRYSGSGTGGGAYVTAGTVTNCLITDNSCGSYQAWGYGSGLYINGGLVVDCIVSNNGAAGWQYGPGVYMNGGTLDRSVICNNSGQQQYLAGGAGVLLDNGTLRNCLIRDNITQGANINGGGVCQRGGTMANCTIVSNTCSYTAGGLYMTAGTAYNLIVAGNANPTNLWQTGGTITYSCAPELTSGTGNITNNPQFMFKGVVPYQLAVGSPCIDAGTNQTWMTNAVDLAGDARILGRRVNMGAYEYVLPAGTGFIFR